MSGRTEGLTPLEHPFQVGNYLVQALLGAGAMGVVYLGTHVILDSPAALKRPFLDGTDPQGRTRFVEEARKQAMMHHPNIAVLYEFFEHEEQPWIAMEYFELGTIRPLITRLSDQEVTLLLADMLRGAEHAHGKNVVHRDLKPENVMRTSDGHSKIADFGIARAFGEAAGPHLTVHGWFHGDARYVAPEVVRGKEAESTSDLYSLGVMAYELLTGEIPFGELPEPEVPAYKLEHPAPSLGDQRPDLDQGLALWVDQLLMRDPLARPESATSALQRLEEVAEESWGPGWDRKTLPRGVPESGINRPPVRPLSHLVSYSAVTSYASTGRLLRNALLHSHALLALIGAAVVAAALAKVFDELRPVLVAIGVLAVYLGVAASLFFDERVAFDVGLKSPKAQPPEPKHSTG